MEPGAGPVETGVGTVAGSGGTGAGPVETGAGPVGTGTPSEPAVDGSEELGVGVLLSVGAEPDVLCALVLVDVVLVPDPVTALVPADGDDVTSARASPTIASASTSATRISVSLRCLGPVIGLRHQAGNPGPAPA